MINNNSIYVFLFRSIRISEERGITIEENLNYVIKKLPFKPVFKEFLYIKRIKIILEWILNGQGGGDQKEVG